MRHRMVIFLFFLLFKDELTKNVTDGKLYNDLEQAIVYDTKNLQIPHRDNGNAIRRTRVLKTLDVNEEATGEDDVSLDSSDLIDEGSIITKQDEETFNSGVHSINQLSNDIKDNKKDKRKNKEKDKKEKDKKTQNAKEKKKKEFSSNIIKRIIICK